MQVFVEPIVPIPTLFMFGAGHIGYTVSKIAKMTGFQVVVINDRPAYINTERFPDADQFYVEDLTQVVPKLSINKVSYIVIACRGHFKDQEVLAQVLKTNAGYIGIIGSKKKTRTILDNLKKEGFNQEAFNRVHAQIDLPIATETPEDIDVSIMAEITDIRRRKIKSGANKIR